jgi:hypothetical protein
MDTRHFVDLEGNYLGGFGTGAAPEVPALEVSQPPHGNCVWFPETGWKWPEDRLACHIRAERDMMLAQTDWTQAPDATVDRAAWVAYRQALRNITEQPGFPADIVWPEPPPTTPVLQPLTRRQLFIALHRLGLINSEEAVGAVKGEVPALIEGIFSSMPEPQQTDARITFASFNIANRMDPLVILLGQTVNLTSQQMDEIWKNFLFV